jgi:hypothetical protein
LTTSYSGGTRTVTAWVRRRAGALPSFSLSRVRIDQQNLPAEIIRLKLPSEDVLFVLKAGNSNEKDNCKCGSLSSVDVFGSDGQRPRKRRCGWDPLGDRSCNSHAGEFSRRTVGCAFSQLETFKRHSGGTKARSSGAEP